MFHESHEEVFNHGFWMCVCLSSYSLVGGQTASYIQKVYWFGGWCTPHCCRKSQKALFAKIIEFLFVMLMCVNLKVKIFNISNIHKPLAWQVVSGDWNVQNFGICQVNAYSFHLLIQKNTKALRPNCKYNCIFGINILCVPRKKENKTTKSKYQVQYKQTS
jgi:hypothetical protein